ncbi:RNA 2',3'-cyclic phosphodiesterase [Marinobacter fonticola]|uniref:RNA 2',3'-cyclic phosphodiesterase n=1 Tax=Marinobacter fonticola TaxID=2603215 RepID=UPI0011E74F87|nr:RNA 2',3'-cyclic phosphodiesterase [Marinobacter fonticola]
MLRLFVGLELPSDTKQQLITLRTELTDAKWQTEEQLHLTLCFIGNVDDEQLDAIYEELYRVTLAPFRLAVNEVGLFGSPLHPQNLWAGVAPESPVKALHEAIHERMAPLGVSPPEKPFRPHVTLARFRRRRSRQPLIRPDRKTEMPVIEHFLERHKQLALPDFHVGHFSLFSSTQRPEGSHYQVIGRFPSDGFD